jgi:hypothetical protein
VSWSCSPSLLLSWVAVAPHRHAQWRLADARTYCVSKLFIIGVVPIICQFMGITIAMYFDDRAPPHFHARSAGGSAKVRVDTLEPIVCDLSCRELRLVLAWAQRNRDELYANWQRAREGTPLTRLD